MEKDLLTIDELAKKWRVPKSWLYSRTRQRGPEAIPVKKLGKYCRFNELAVERWLERQQEK